MTVDIYTVHLLINEFTNLTEPPTIKEEHVLFVQILSDRVM